LPRLSPRTSTRRWPWAGGQAWTNQQYTHGPLYKSVTSERFRKAEQVFWGGSLGWCRKGSKPQKSVWAGLYTRVIRCGEVLWEEGGFWHEAIVLVGLPLEAPIGLSPLYIPTLCGSERVLVVSTEPPDDLSCLTTPGVGCPGDGLLPVPLTRCIQMHTPSPCWVCRLQH